MSNLLIFYLFSCWLVSFVDKSLCETNTHGGSFVPIKLSCFNWFELKSTMIAVLIIFLILILIFTIYLVLISLSYCFFSLNFSKHVRSRIWTFEDCKMSICVETLRDSTDRGRIALSWCCPMSDFKIVQSKRHKSRRFVKVETNRESSPVEVDVEKVLK